MSTEDTPNETTVPETQSTDPTPAEQEELAAPLVSAVLDPAADIFELCYATHQVFRKLGMEIHHLFTITDGGDNHDRVMVKATQDDKIVFFDVGQRGMSANNFASGWEAYCNLANDGKNEGGRDRQQAVFNDWLLRTDVPKFLNLLSEKGFTFPGDALEPEEPEDEKTQP